MKPKQSGASPLTITALLLSILSICMFCGVFFANSTSRYVLYIGTNDKDTLRAEIPLGEAREIVKDICLQHGIDYTVAEAQGVWTNAEGAATTEDTLMLILYGVSGQAVSTVCADIASSLNQQSILIEKGYVNTYYTNH